jgi:hypothetical protein
MYLIRDVFRCKPGKAGAVAEKFKQAFSAQTDAAPHAWRVMVDAVANYWTVVLELEVEDLAAYEQQLRDFGTNPAVREAMSGYLDLVEGGHREIYRLV